MPVIQCDIREGWSDEQKRALASGLTKVVAEVGKVPIKSVHIVIREGRGLHYVRRRAGARIQARRGRLKQLWK